MKTFTALSLAAWLSFPVSAAEPEAFTGGEIRLVVISGSQETELRYRLKDGRLRIDRPGEIIPAPPVNLIDLASGTLTILHPHNGTMEKVPAASLRSPAPRIGGLPVPPPGIGPQQLPEIALPGQPGRLPTSPSEPSPIGPAALESLRIPQLPEIPRLPERPPLPALPAATPRADGIPGGVTGPPAIPQVAARKPPMFPGQAPPLELKDTGERREIHGYPCTRHTLIIPREGEMTLWLTDPGRLPPFHLLAEDKPGPAQPRDELEKIPALLRDKNLFPLLAELKGEDGRVALRWELTRITTDPVEDASLFQVPASFQRLDAP